MHGAIERAMGVDDGEGDDDEEEDEEEENEEGVTP